MIEQLQSMTAQLSTMLGRGDIVRVHTEPMASDEQGFSGAAMLRLRADYKDGTQESFICKRADLKERMVMKMLTEPYACRLFR